MVEERGFTGDPIDSDSFDLLFQIFYGTTIYIYNKKKKLNTKKVNKAPNKTIFNIGI